MNGLVLTACVPQNLGNPVISVNYCSFLRLENETSLDARLPSILTNVKIEGGRGYRPGSKPLYATHRQQTFMAFVYLLYTMVFVYLQIKGIQTVLSASLTLSLAFPRWNERTT